MLIAQRGGTDVRMDAEGAAARGRSGSVSMQDAGWPNMGAWEHAKCCCLIAGLSLHIKSPRPKLSHDPPTWLL
jgi:hypothetical protein